MDSASGAQTICTSVGAWHPEGGGNVEFGLPAASLAGRGPGPVGRNRRRGMPAILAVFLSYSNTDVIIAKSDATSV